MAFVPEMSASCIWITRSRSPAAIAGDEAGIRAPTWIAVATAATLAVAGQAELTTPVSAALGPSLPGVTHPRPAAVADSGGWSATPATASMKAVPMAMPGRRTPRTALRTSFCIVLGGILGVWTPIRIEFPDAPLKLPGRVQGLPRWSRRPGLQRGAADRRGPGDDARLRRPHLRDRRLQRRQDL